MRISDWSSDVCSSDLRHEDAAQHEVLDVDARLLAGRDVAPGHVCGDLLGQLDALAIEHAERLGLASLPEGDLLDGVVHRGVGMIADHGLGDIAAALLRNVLELGAGGLLQADRDDLRSEEHTSELQSLMRISYAVFCLQKKTTQSH